MNKEEIRSIGKLLILHLFPGVMLSVIYVFVLKLGILNEYPKVVALGLASMLSIVPIELGYLFYVAKKEERSFNIFKILGLKGKMNVKEYILYTLFLLIIAGAVMVVLKPITKFMQSTILSWIPSWYNYVEDVSRFNRKSIVITIIVEFLFFTLIVPITEEFYFRGYLLTRMKWMGKYSVILNSVLFAIYHFWSPWLIVPRIIALTPLFYYVYKKNSLKLGIFVHCLANFSDVVSLLMLL